MERRRFLEATGLALAAAAWPRAAGAARPRRRPNVVLVVTDDQHLDSFGFLRH